MPFEILETETQGTIIKVIGIGGAGGNAVEHMIRRGVQGVEFICANTDHQALSRSSAKNVIQLGETGLGAGSRPDMGRLAASRGATGSPMRCAERIWCSSRPAWAAEPAPVQRRWSPGSPRNSGF